MADDLQIHAASRDELAAAHTNVFDIWSKGLPLDEHVPARLESPKHRLARWYVGCLDGRVVVSLGCYPLEFDWRGELLQGFAIGSVYTVGEFRGHGYAPRLLQWVEQHEHSAGAALSLLYSDINPDYYARLGYARCPSLEGWTDPRTFSPERRPAHRLEPIAAIEHLPELATLYAGYHGAMPLSIARDAGYWQSLLDRAPDDRFYRLADGRGGWHGYLRVAVAGTTWRITDFALGDQSLELAEELYAAALLVAGESGVERFGGWLPDHPSARQFFDLTERRIEITMIKSLDSARPLDDESVELASRFCEIDHV